VTAYEVRFAASAAKEFRSLPPELKGRVKEAVDRLKENPRPAGVKKLKGVDLYRIRVGSYRVVYEIDDKKVMILVTRVRHRREAY